MGMLAVGMPSCELVCQGLCSGCTCNDGGGSADLFAAAPKAFDDLAGQLDGVGLFRAGLGAGVGGALGGHGVWRGWTWWWIGEEEDEMFISLGEVAMMTLAHWVTGAGGADPRAEQARAPGCLWVAGRPSVSKYSSCR